WVYVARLCIASAIFLAAVLVSLNHDAPEDSNRLLIASVVLLVTFAVTAASVFYGRLAKNTLPPTWYYLQTIFDLLLVTAVVHLTRDSIGTSQFAALYILVIASSSLLLPVGGSLLIAALGN